MLSSQHVGLQSFLIFVLSFSCSQLISVCRDNKKSMMFTDDRLSYFVTVLTAIVIVCLAALPLQITMTMSAGELIYQAQELIVIEVKIV